MRRVIGLILLIPCIVHADILPVVHPNLGALNRSAAASCSDTELTGITAFWPMDEGSGTNVADVSGNGFTGTGQNTPTWVAGTCGNALSFASASSERVSIANQPVIGPNQDVWTIFVRFKNTDGTAAAIYGEGLTTSDDPNITIYHTGVSGGINFAIRDQALNDGSASTADLNLDDGAWHSACFVSSGTTFRRGLVDGIQRVTNTTTVDFSAGQLTTSNIGAQQGTGIVDHMNGQIDQVRIYAGRALTNGEVLALHNSNK